MKGFIPGLFDRLMGADSAHTSSDVVTRLSMDSLKDTVARDLEAMLNTRTVIPEELLRRFPECSNSILTYGLNDFSGMSLASIDDRAHICRCLEQSVARHEPRLKNVRASLELREGSINRLNFAISAMLVVHSTQEPVSFDAVLQPSTLQYSISKTRRAMRGGS